MTTLGVADSKAQIDSGTITGATINNCVIGGTTPVAGTFTNLTSTGNTALGDAATDTLGFFGTTAIAQRAGATQATIGTTTATTGSGVFGFTNSTQFSAAVAQLEEIRAALVAYGLLKGAA
jgi:hypothetical protein